ncbi:MAG: hypothetical protein FWD34_09155 [Oscillospiraceae bacterium]|nr:hypothetical protein [Oscillospiraceae bacterium]
MSVERIPTDTLLQKLLKTTSLNRFFQRYSEDTNSVIEFCEYINKLCTERETLPERVIKKSDIERTYGHQLFNGRRSPSRDKVIQLAFGFEMNYDETQKLLTCARKSTLHPRIKRDAVIIFALENGLDIEAVQDTLFEFSISLLGEKK